LKLGRYIFFRETEFIYLFLCTANVHNNIQFRGKNRKFVVLKFVKLCDEVVTNLIFFFDSQCTAKSDTSVYGTCYTASECTDKAQ
jgi:hypothetical protein